MPSTLEDLTLTEFAARIAAGPTPAGVAVSATAAAFALQLLAMALEVSARHRKFNGDSAAFARLRTDARAAAATLMRHAQEDSAAYVAYLNCLRMPDHTDQERTARRQAIAGALGRAIAIPLAAADTAARGLELCAEGASAVQPAVAADLGASAELLAGAVRAILLSVDANTRRLARDDDFRLRAVAQRNELAGRAARHAERVRAILERPAAV